jgi:hypothetical protein
VPRTLVDLAYLLNSKDLARGRRPPGVANLRAILHGDIHVTLSALEQTFLERLRAVCLPLPLTNKVTDGRRVYCRWPTHHLTVELHGYQFHNSRHAWEQDLEREREARKREDEYRRFTYHDVFEDPTYMLDELRKLLSPARSAARAAGRP